MNSSFDPERIPQPLRRFAEFVHKWGRRMEREGRDGRIERIQADPIAMKELTAFAKAFTKADWEAMDEWGDQSSDLETHEQTYFHMLHGLLDELELVPEEDDEEEPTIEDLIADLQRRGGLGAASKRGYAAMELAKHHGDAQTAVPHLRRLLSDLDFRVRVWARCALGRIVPGEHKKHTTAIQAICKACIEENKAVSLGDGETGSSARHKVVCSLILEDADDALKVLDDGHDAASADCE